MWKNKQSASGDSLINVDLRAWRAKISDAVFFFFTTIGLVTGIPSVIHSLREGFYGLAAATVVIYVICVFLTLVRRIPYAVRAVFGALIFFSIGVILLAQVGPRGVGYVWLFSAPILVSLLLGNRAGAAAAGLTAVILSVFYLLLRRGTPAWGPHYGIDAASWLVTSINIVLLDAVLLLCLGILTRGFRSLIIRSIETRNASIVGLAKLAEHRDKDTGDHLMRIQNYVVLLARALAEKPSYRKYITEDYIEDLKISSILHDIGKVGILDAILLKPGPLTDTEFSAIKKHPVIGVDVIKEIEKGIKGVSLYTLGKEIALSHHERWDGTGYPNGLAGNEIPLSARIAALADVYDALTSKRVYKDSIPHLEAVRMIAAGRGTQFDPEIVDVFLRVADEFSAESTPYSGH